MCSNTHFYDVIVYLALVSIFELSNGKYGLAGICVASVPISFLPFVVALIPELLIFSRFGYAMRFMVRRVYDARWIYFMEYYLLDCPAPPLSVLMFSDLSESGDFAQVFRTLAVIILFYILLR